MRRARRRRWFGRSGTRLGSWLGSWLGPRGLCERWPARGAAQAAQVDGEVEVLGDPPAVALHGDLEIGVAARGTEDGGELQVLEVGQRGRDPLVQGEAGRGGRDLR